MSLSGALGFALSGLRAAQAGTDVVASNIANAGTVGYKRRALVTAEAIGDGRIAGVQTLGVKRAVDRAVERQFLVETAGSGYATTRAAALSDLDRLFGEPGGAGALDTLFNAFSGALEALAIDPASATLRSDVLARAGTLASQLNGLAGDVTQLRQDAENALAADAVRADGLLQGLERLNSRIAGLTTPLTAPALLDERDRIIADLSGLIDVRVAERADGTVSLSTGAGYVLFDGQQASRIVSDGPQSLTAASRYDDDPARRGVGTLSVVSPSGFSADLLSAGALRSGRLAGLVQVRDVDLVAAQDSLDALAARLATSMSRRDIAGVAANAGPASGFDLDLSALAPGDSFTIATADAATGAVRRFSFVRVEDASQLPLPDSATDDPADTVLGLSFAGGAGAIATQVAAALGPGFSVVSPAAGTLRVLDDGAPGGTGITAAAAQATQASLRGGGPELPLFVDARTQTAYTGAFQDGAQKLGIAGRIAVNPQLAADPASLVLYDAGIAAGDQTRPLFMIERLTAEQALTATDWAGGGARAEGLTTLGLARRVIGANAERAAQASRDEASQEAITRAIDERLAGASGVDVDGEMARLVELQTAYAANARIVTAIRDMFDQLMRV